MFFTQWKHTAASDSDTVVVPDGCRDILLVEDAHCEASVILTDWDDRARTAQLTKGQRITGYRLCPGLSVNDDELLELKADEKAINNFIEYLAAANNETINIVRELADSTISLQSVATQAGVSTRTLQRQFKKLKLPRPEYWRLLSRARLAASALTSRAPLTEIALANGYSDQSHMTRDLTRWFGVTPAQLRQDSSLLKTVNQLGLGNWTGEHISIK